MDSRARQNKIRGKLAATVRHHPEDLATINRLRVELKASHAEDAIADLLSYPSPPADERARLADLLRAA